MPTLYSIIDAKWWVKVLTGKMLLVGSDVSVYKVACTFLKPTFSGLSLERPLFRHLGRTISTPPSNPRQLAHHWFDLRPGAPSSVQLIPKFRRRNMKDTIKHEASRAVAGACRMQSVIRNTAEPDPLVLCPSHRQSYPFNSLWLFSNTQTKKMMLLSTTSQATVCECSDNTGPLLMV